MSSTLTRFAEHRRLKIRRDECGDRIISGRRGDHIYDMGDGRLAVCLMFPTKMRWTYAKKKLRGAGFIVRQDGDTEGTATFDPDDGAQARLAIRITRARVKRQASPAQLAALQKALASKRALALETTQGAGIGI